MFDKILGVVRITGEFLSFYAIVYLEDGIYPSAVTRVDFVAGSGFMGFRQSAKLTEVESSVSHLAKGISTLYAYPILTVSDRKSLESRYYVQMLETTLIDLAARREGDFSATRARAIKRLH